MVKDFYSTQSWGKSPPRANLEAREKKSLSLLLKKTRSRRQTFLDLDCGDGCFLFSTALLDPNLELYGIDASETQLKKRRKGFFKSVLAMEILSHNFAMNRIPSI